MTNRHYEYPDSVGENIAELLGELQLHIADESFRQRLARSLQQLTDIKFSLDQSSIVAITDRRGVIQYVNDKFCEISKYSRQELIGQDHRIINSGYHSKQFIKDMWATIGSGRVWHGEFRNKAKDGTFYWVNTTIVPFLDENNRPFQYLAVRHEVTRLKQAEEELQRMMTKVINIQEEERKRFSRELHDGIGQSMFSLLIQIDRQIARQSSPELEQLRKDVTFIMEDIRSLAWELRPSVLDDLGVVPAIRTFLDNYSSHYGIEVEFNCNLRGRLGIEKETVIYRVAQEALQNIGKYAEADQAKLTIHETESEVTVTVEDEGRGFVRTRHTKGVGLFSMEERARGVGGSLTIESIPGKGTKVQLAVPK